MIKWYPAERKMTSRNKNAVRIYETEIEKSREESNWKKAVELAQQLKSRSPQHGQFCLPITFFIC